MTIITRAEVVRFAKITTTLTADQESTIDDMIDAATPVLESIAGPVDLTTATYTGRPPTRSARLLASYRGGDAVARSAPIPLPWPFVTITSVTVDGTLVAATDYDTTRKSFGLLDPAVGCDPWAGATKVVVVATIGGASAPANVKLAALELVSYWWQSTQQSQRSAWSDGGPPMGFAVPQRVRDLLGPTYRLPGIG